MDAIKTLLDRYGIIEPPALTRKKGVFTNPKLQAKCTSTLIDTGSDSQIEALGVGVIIEETDIDDLGNYAIELTTPQRYSRPSIAISYKALWNHLKAF